ncbi:hypothetical protein BC938DRAFT_472893 [Jimgerdemannia flammicorona]|uniref:Sugar phosphate phosphatase n=1 Tax=Jimgerdemannia flammicorona TaxID=994334 RepID=A0A433QTM4_9FUNG|nr:hypothetical protein BC938DRAFT_472893 [Jimgerdemannia flammicorona]
MSSAPTPNNPPCPAYRCQEKDSFAYPTAVERWPVILTNVIDDVYKSYRDEVDPQKQREAKEIIERIGALKYEMQRDRPFSAYSNSRPIEEDGSTDYTTWNAILSQDFPNSSWFSATWLFSECYLYRRVRESFNLTTTWSGYDPFFRQKTSTFQGSSSAVFDLARRFSVPIPSQSDTERHLWFHELAQVCLWGNATDLSLLVNMTEENIKSLQATGAQRLEEQEKNIIVNDLERVWEKVKEMKGGRVDFVLDNAGNVLMIPWLRALRGSRSGRLPPPNLGRAHDLLPLQDDSLVRLRYAPLGFPLAARLVHEHLLQQRLGARSGLSPCSGPPLEVIPGLGRIRGGVGSVLVLGIRVLAPTGSGATVVRRIERIRPGGV